MDIDPVCGMTVNPATARQIEHAGKTYYFCSASCDAKFKAAPGQYTGAKPSHADHEHQSRHAHTAALPAVAVKAGAQYTCPMHPEIVRDGPGDCPLCGMPLVPIAGTGEDDGSELRNMARHLG